MENDEPLINVIIPAYNGEQWVRLAIKEWTESRGNPNYMCTSTFGSMMAQTHENFKIIAIDNDSNDDTKAALEEFKELAPEISERLDILHEKKKGVAAARNRGFFSEEAAGDWFATVDIDEYVNSSHLHDTLELAKQHPADKVALFGSPVEAIFKDGTTTIFPENCCNSTETSDLHRAVAMPSTWLFSRHTLNSVGPQNVDFLHWQDREWQLRLLQHKDQAGNFGELINKRYVSVHHRAPEPHKIYGNEEKTLRTVARENIGWMLQHPDSWGLDFFARQGGASALLDLYGPLLEKERPAFYARLVGGEYD
jgi:glycosyltransferase involved in cell wall biosynthesis